MIDRLGGDSDGQMTQKWQIPRGSWLGPELPSLQRHPVMPCLPSRLFLPETPSAQGCAAQGQEGALPAGWLLSRGSGRAGALLALEPVTWTCVAAGLEGGGILWS